MTWTDLPRAFSWLAFLALSTQAAPEEPCVPQPVAGFGANGPCGMRVDTVPGSEAAVGPAYVFTPDTLASPAPVIFFFHRYGSSSPAEYSSFIRHIVSRGYAVVYPPFRRMASLGRSDLQKERVFIEGYAEAARSLGGRIDTTRIGIVGHGLGGGVTPALGRLLIKGNGWGARGAFLFVMAPWYVYGIDERELGTYPQNVKVLVQVYDEDNVNDPRIARDLFAALGVQEKTFIVVKSDRWGSCKLRADNFTPLSREAFAAADDALDFYGIWRPFDQMAAYTFSADSAAGDTLFHATGAREIFMGRWPDSVAVKPAVQTPRPEAYFSKGPFVNSWHSPRNPRIDLSRFRKARKVYFSHLRNLAAVVASTGAAMIKRQEKHMDDFDILENPILTGNGSPGPHPVAVDAFPAAADAKLNVTFMRPADIDTPVPVVFFIPGYGTTEPIAFEPLLSHIVSKGYAVVFSPYPALPMVDEEKGILEKYRIVLQGFEDAVVRYGKQIDLSRIGFYGQSFGGGAVPAIARKCLVEHRWGATGAFMHITAPWYVCGISPEHLAAFPANVKLVVEIFDDDRMNDHQMAVDLFNNIGIAPGEKDFLTVFSDSLEGFRMPATHYTPYGVHHTDGQLDLLDYYGIYKIFDALADYALTGNPAAKNVALGGGSREQCFMGEWDRGRPVRPLAESKNPRAAHPELQYAWAWDSKINPRRSPTNKGGGSHEKNDEK